VFVERNQHKNQVKATMSEAKRCRKSRTMKKEPHKTLKMPLKMIEVDEKIAPVVRWLNSYPSVHTLFSCQGSAKDKRRDPHVVFACDHFRDLCKIVNGLPSVSKSKTRIEIMPSCDIRALVYRLSFVNQMGLEDFLNSPLK
jgi:hypothetical protein